MWRKSGAMFFFFFYLLIFTLQNWSPKFLCFDKNLNIFAKRSSWKIIFFKIFAKQVLKWTYIYERIYKKKFSRAWIWLQESKRVINYWQVALGWINCSLKASDFSVCGEGWSVKNTGDSWGVLWSIIYNFFGIFWSLRAT